MFKPLSDVLVAEKVRRQELEGNCAFKFGVLNLIDDAPAALAELFGLADHVAPRTRVIVPLNGPPRAEDSASP